jgi:hypothetical protein
MNKNFVLMDKTNNTQRNATAVIKFNYENNDYLIYSIDENEVNKQIFVSKLILNSEGKSFIDNILPEEKNKLSNVVYNIIILTPSNFKKGALANNLLKDIKEKLMVNLSLEIPELGSQEYFANCSIAITNKEFVEDAIKFYNDNLNMEKVQEQIPVTPTWTIPTEEPVAINEPSINQEPMQNNINISPIPSAIPQTNPQPVIPNATSNNIESVPTEPVNIVNPTIETPNQVVTPETVQIPNIEGQKLNNIPNPQAEKLNNVAVVSDPSLGNSGLNIQPNIGKQKNAGFTLNKYIVIGTVCILLAIAVVIVAYILIQKKINGA